MMSLPKASAPRPHPEEARSAVSKEEGGTAQSATQGAYKKWLRAARAAARQRQQTAMPVVIMARCFQLTASPLLLAHAMASVTPKDILRHAGEELMMWLFFAGFTSAEVIRAQGALARMIVLEREIAAHLGGEDE